MAKQKTLKAVPTCGGVFRMTDKVSVTIVLVPRATGSALYKLDVANNYPFKQAAYAAGCADVALNECGMSHDSLTKALEKILPHLS